MRRGKEKIRRDIQQSSFSFHSKGFQWPDTCSRCHDVSQLAELHRMNSALELWEPSRGSWPCCASEIPCQFWIYSPGTVLWFLLCTQVASRGRNLFYMHSYSVQISRTCGLYRMHSVTSGETTAVIPPFPLKGEEKFCFVTVRAIPKEMICKTHRRGIASGTFFEHALIIRLYFWSKCAWRQKGMLGMSAPN